MVNNLSYFKLCIDKSDNNADQNNNLYKGYLSMEQHVFEILKKYRGCHRKKISLILTAVLWHLVRQDPIMLFFSN